MYKIMLSLTISILFPTIMMILLLFLSKKSLSDREKMSPFECGFDSKSKARMPFSIQFFLISILFLIFDIEVAIILPMMITMKTSNLLTWSMTVTMFIMILILGLYYEWNNNMLEWTK